jgi:hypothetical protein
MGKASRVGLIKDDYGPLKKGERYRIGGEGRDWYSVCRDGKLIYTPKDCVVSLYVGSEFDDYFDLGLLEEV